MAAAMKLTHVVSLTLATPMLANTCLAPAIQSLFFLSFESGPLTQASSSFEIKSGSELAQAKNQCPSTEAPFHSSTPVGLFLSKVSFFVSKGAGEKST